MAKAANVERKIIIPRWLRKPLKGCSFGFINVCYELFQAPHAPMYIFRMVDVLGLVGIEEKKINWLKWENLCVLKGQGCFGFKDLKTFNLAFVDKQC